jgi:putative addiction module CopG family antidote
LLLSRDAAGMNVSLSAELKEVIREKIRSGLYHNASEVVRDALRRAFFQPEKLDLEEDSPELAILIRESMRSRHVPHRKGEVRKLLSKSLRGSRKRHS